MALNTNIFLYSQLGPASYLWVLVALIF
jgi:hypothetical protein